MTQDELYELKGDILRYFDGSSDLYWKLSVEQVEHVKTILSLYFEELIEIKKQQTKIENRKRLGVSLDE
jgi:hypothetical protein